MAVSYEEYQQAQSDVMLYQQRVSGYQIKVLEYQGDYNTYKAALAAGVSTADPAILPKIEKKLAQATENLDLANSDLSAAKAKVSEFISQPTVPSASDTASANKMAKAEIVGDTSTPPAAAPTALTPAKAEKVVDAPGTRSVPGVPKGAEPAPAPPISVNVKDSKGNTKNPDLRVKIRVPSSYLTATTSGSAKELSTLGGIIFPYTPTISYEHKADYASSNPMHNNFAINFYQRSSISNISISGKFTVQNEKDAAVYLATVHLLRALTKMKSGGEVMSGAPPPVCRLDAYGDYMMANVPVAIGSFRIELPDGVDYFTSGQKSSSPYGLASVPIVSTIAITCIPMYSRAEMQKFTVSGWLSDANVRKSGIL